MHPFRARSLATLVALTGLAAGLGVVTPAAAAGPPGLTRGARVTLDVQQQLSQPSVATQSDGTSYVAWIATVDGAPELLREVRVCTLTVGGAGCSHVARVDALGPSSATSARVFTPAPGAVVVAWYRQLPTAEGLEPRGGRVSVATSSDGGATFTPARDVGDAPTNGDLIDAKLAGGQLWSVTQSTSQSFTAVEVRSSPLASTTLARGGALVDFGRPTREVALALDPRGPLLVSERTGSISEPLEVAHAAAGADPSVSASWTPGATVAGAAGTSFDLVPVPGGTRLVGYSDPSTERLVTLAWNGSSFGKPVFSGYEHKCPDLAMDTAGRGNPASTYTSYECDAVRVGNLADGKQLAVGAFPAAGTTVRDPALAASPRGTGVVAWGVSNSSPPGETLYAQRVVVPIVLRGSTQKASAGNLKLSTPVGCVPPTSAKLTASARLPRGSTLATPLSITVDRTTTRGATRLLDASRWAPGSRHLLAVTTTARSTNSRGVAVTRSLTLRRTVTSCG